MAAPPSAHAAAADRPLLSSLSGLSDQDLADRLAAHVAGTASETLGYPRYHALPRQRGLFDLGFDSLLAMDLRRRLARDFGRAFPATLVFDHPTIERLAAHLASCLADELCARPTAPALERPQVRAAVPAPAPAAADPRPGSPRAGVEPIAIVGIGCRFPGGAVDLDTFWQLLRDGRDATSETERFDDAPAGASVVRRAGFLPDIASFDIPSCSASRHARRRAWIRSSACCSR